jgi:dolichol-phosphate mannosyltransferase
MIAPTSVVARTRISRLFAARFVRFAAVGLSGAFVNLGFLYVFAEMLQLGDTLSSASAIEISIVWNFVLNNAITFADRNTGAEAGVALRFLRYNLVGLVGLGLQLGIFISLNRLFLRTFGPSAGFSGPGRWRYLSQCVGIGVAMGWNFVSNFFWTWSQRKAPEATLSTTERSTGVDCA